MATVRTSTYVRSRSTRPAPLHGVRSRRTCRACGRSLWRMDSGPYRWLWCPQCDPWLQGPSDTYPYSEA